MDYGDRYCGLYRDYYRDAFPHSLLSTRDKSVNTNRTAQDLKPCQMRGVKVSNDPTRSVWFLVGMGGMDYGDHY